MRVEDSPVASDEQQLLTKKEPIQESFQERIMGILRRCFCRSQAEETGVAVTIKSYIPRPWAQFS